MIWQAKLRMIMEKQGIKQKDLAERLGVAGSTISNLLQGDIRLSSLEKIAYVLDVQVADLFTDNEEEKPPVYDEEYRKTHVHGYIRIGNRVVEVNSIKELRDALTACEVNYLK